MPAYCCPSLAAVFRNEGCSVRRYALSRGFRPVFPLPGPAGEDVVLVIHYFGFPNQAALAWFRSRAQHCRPFLIEDCAGASLTGGIGLEGDFTLFSFRKFFQVPDGGALVSRFSISLLPGAGDEKLERLRTEAFSLMREGKHRQGFQALSECEAILDDSLLLLPRRPSPASWDFLGKVSLQTESLRRRKAAMQILSGISSGPDAIATFRPIFSSVPDSSAPLVLPVEVLRGSREKLSSKLQEEGFESPSLWELNPSLRYAFPAETRLGNRVIGLPVNLQSPKRDCRAIMKILEDFSTSVG